MPPARLVAEGDAHVAGRANLVAVGGDGFQLAGHLAERDGNDQVVADGDHVAELLLRNQLRCRSAKAGGEHTVIGAGRAASLEMARNGDADLLPGALGNLVGQAVGDRRLLHLGAGSFKFLLGELGLLLGDGALRHRQDGEGLALHLALFQHLADLVHIVGQLRNQDDVRTARDAGIQSQPADLVAHHLDNKDASVGGGGSVDAVDDVGGDVDRALEAKGHVGAPQVVVDRFGQADDVDAVLCQQVCGLVGTVAAQDDQAVELIFPVIFQHHVQLGLAAKFRHGQAHRFKRLAGGAQNGAAQGEDAGKIAGVHLADVPVDQSAVSVPDAVDVHILSKDFIQRLADAAQSGV